MEKNDANQNIFISKEKQVAGLSRYSSSQIKIINL